MKKAQKPRRLFRWGRVKVVTMFLLLALMLYFLAVAILVWATNLIVVAIILVVAYLYLVRLAFITGSVRKAWRR